MTRDALLAATCLLLSPLAVACGAFTSSPDPAASPTVKGSSFDLTGTVWKRDLSPGDATSGDNCTPYVRNLTFEADGTFSYESMCEGDEIWRLNDQPNDLWSVDTGQLSMMYNGGFQRCTGPVDKREMTLECRNANGTSQLVLEPSAKG